MNLWFKKKSAEGSFIISIQKEPKNKTGWTVKSRFSIGLHVNDREILELIKYYFKGKGTITKQGNNSVQYRVASLKDLTNVIISHFDNHPLITQKKADFLLFKKVVNLMNLKEHLTQEGLHEIVGIRASINLGLSEELKSSFPDIVVIKRPLIQNHIIIDPNWLAGFVSGEGCFFINIKTSSNFRLAFQVLLVFKLTQHLRDEQLMKSLVKYLGCGTVSYDRESISFWVTKFQDITDKVIPFFDEYRIVGVKFQDYLDFKKVAGLMRNRDHLTPEGLDLIRKIKANMNKKEN